jgi:hypothetical protein
VHVNLTRGLSHDAAGRGVLKLAGTTLQHAVEPVDEEELEPPLGVPAAVLDSHAQLAPLAWAFARATPGARLGYVQVSGGGLAGALAPAVAELVARGLLAGHVTAGEAFGGRDGEALTAAGAIGHGVRRLGWDAVVCGPGPTGGEAGGSEGGREGPAPGLRALDAAHAALALGCPTLLVAAMAGTGAGHGVAAGTLAVLDLLLGPVTVALPAGIRSPVGSELRASLRPVFASIGGQPGKAPELARPARIARHDWRRADVELPAFARAGLVDVAAVAGDPLRFAAALAGGTALAALAGEGRRVAELESA